MIRTRISRSTTCQACIVLLACVAVAFAQTPNSTGVIRLRVRVSTGNGSKAQGLSRKRFFLIRGSLSDNAALLQSFAERPIVSRDCYYRSIGASEALLAWLKDGDCESIYCRSVDQLEVDKVPEFKLAMATGEKVYGSRELARQWLSTNLPENINSGFYKHQQAVLTELLAQAERQSQARVSSVMTDSNGTAYFTDIEPGLYVISNVMPAEVADSSELWLCEVKVSLGDLATATRERPYLISDPNNRDPRDKKNIKCVSLERPLPACRRQ